LRKTQLFFKEKKYLERGKDAVPYFFAKMGIYE